MPELPEVDIVRQTLLPYLRGRKIIDVGRSRFKLRQMLSAKDLEVLKGLRVKTITRRAKYLLFEFINAPNVLAVHLGMTGSFRVSSDDCHPKQKHDHFILMLDNKTQVIFNDPRRFGMVFMLKKTEILTHAAFKNLGPEPLSQQFTPRIFLQILKNKKQAIKQALLDQRVVVGVGNIYASEALYRAGISPLKAAGKLGSDEITRLHRAICQVLKAAIRAGGSTIRDFKAADGTSGYFSHSFAVYGREGKPCKGCHCHEKILKITQGGRSTFYCPQKQR